MVNTNAQMVNLGNLIAQGSDAGYRHLKPKKDVTKVTCEGAEELMVELMQFEVDMGELGVSLMSEAAYRQLRAAVSGKAREVLDLEQVRGGQITYLSQSLETAIMSGQGKPARDSIGGQLYAQCVFARRSG